MTAELAEQKQARPDRITVQIRVLEIVHTAVQLGIRWGALIWIVSLASSAISALAGKHTFADIGIRVLANVSISEGTAYVFGCVGISYGLLQRHLRRNEIQRLAPRIQELERQIDPKRSSSALMPRGTTRPEDIQ